MTTDAEKIRTLCALSNRDSPAETLKRLLADLRPHWRELHQRAKENHIIPQISLNISKNNLANLLPETTAETLLAAPRKTAAFNLLLLAEARRIIDSAAEREIDLIPMKGITFIDRIYTIGERPITDIDFLACEDRISDLKPLMEKLGYGKYESCLPKDFARDFSGETKFTTGRGELPIEVEFHWDISPGPELKKGFSFDAPTLWALSSEKDGRLALTLEGEILYHIFHLAIRHSFSRLLWLLDLHYLISSSAPDWNLLAELFRKTGLTPAAAHTLRFLHGNFNTDIPDTFKKPAARVDGKSLITDKLIVKALAGNATVKKSGIIPFLLSERGPAFLFNTLFPPPEFLRERYPGVPASLRFLYRPAGFAAKLFSAAVKDRP